MLDRIDLAEAQKRIKSSIRIILADKVSDAILSCIMETISAEFADLRLSTIEENHD